jgi:Tol biopolymer transport system component
MARATGAARIPRHRAGRFPPKPQELIVIDKIMLISTVGGVGADGDSNLFFGDVSSRGNLVVFDSAAPGLPDSDGNTNVYVWNAGSGGAGAVAFVAGVDPTHGTGATFDAAISGDGRYVAFVGPYGYDEFVDDAHNHGDTQQNLFSANYDQVFIEDLLTGEITVVSQAGVSASVAVDPTGAPPLRPGDSLHPSVSSDGSHVAFDTVAQNLQGGSASNPDSQVYVWDAATNQDILVSGVNGVAGSGGLNLGAGLDGSFLPSISADGNSIVF